MQEIYTEMKKVLLDESVYMHISRLSIYTMK